MALFFTSTLLVSIVALVLLLLLKRYEMRTGHVFIADARPFIERLARKILEWFEYTLPSMVRMFARQAGMLAREVATTGAARGVLAFERWLERVLQRVRTATTRTPEGGGQVSSFLREVAEHKRKLQRKPRTKRHVVE